MSRKCWIVTHGRSGGFLTYDLFAAEPTKFHLCSIDECHFTTDGTVVYTYLHFKEYITGPVLTAFMDKMKAERGIIPFEIFGYDSIAKSSGHNSITDHIGFKMLADHYLKNNPAFQACTDGKPEITRGLLWNYDSMTRLKVIVNSRSKKLAAFLETLEKESSENKQKAELAEILQEQLIEKEAKIKELGRYKFICHVLKNRMAFIDQKSRDILLADDHHGRPLVL